MIHNSNPSSMNERADMYPSRSNLKAQFIKRKEPIVYSAPSVKPPLDQSLIDQYANDGFMVVEDVFTPEEVAMFRRELNRLRVDPAIEASGETITEYDSDEVRSVFRIHQVSEVFKRLAGDPRLAGIARYLLDDDVYIHQSRLNYKPGFHGKEFYWHSDFETWHVEDGMPAMRALSISVTLTENHTNNGPLMLIPGSHKEFVVCEGHTPAEHFRSSLKKQDYGVPNDGSLCELAAQGGIFTATGKPGSIIVFDCNTMHGSNSNISPFPRSNAFIVYNAMSNRVGAPYCDRSVRPEYICSRDSISPIATGADYD